MSKRSTFSELSQQEHRRRVLTESEQMLVNQVESSQLSPLIVKLLCITQFIGKYQQELNSLKKVRDNLISVAKDRAHSSSFIQLLSNMSNY